jgi:hypothetical protein
MSFKTSLIDRGVSATDLDEIVHDAASQLATNANNSGIANQIEFLTTTCGWSERSIHDALHDAGTIF